METMPVDQDNKRPKRENIERAKNKKRSDVLIWHELNYLTTKAKNPETKRVFTYDQAVHVLMDAYPFICYQTLRYKIKNAAKLPAEEREAIIATLSPRKNNFDVLKQAWA